MEQAAYPLGFAPIAPARRQLVTRAVCDGLRMGLATSFAEGVGPLMRTLGTSWMAPRRMWTCTVESMRGVLADLEEEAASLPDHDVAAVRGIALDAWRSPTPDFFAEVLDVQLMPLEGGGFALASAFDPLIAKAAKSVQGRFQKHAKAWEIRRPRQQILDALLRVAGVRESFVFEHDAPMLLEDLGGASSSPIPISVPAAMPSSIGEAAEATESAGSGFLSALGTGLQRLQVDEAQLARASLDCGLRDYQVAGVRHLLSWTSALLADDMGLGKTRQAVVAGRLAAGRSIVLVVCPASLAINWQREIHAVYPAARVATSGADDMATQRSSDWIVTNYERLGALTRAKDLTIGCMLTDEAHFLKAPEAGRTRNAFVLAQRIPRRFLLTGTPLLSREIELHTLLRLSGHPLGELTLAQFRARFSGDSAKRAELAGQLDQWMLRRSKDVLKDLGRKTHQLRHLQASDGLAGYRAIYDDMSLMPMPKITKLRQHLEELKVDFLIESIEAMPEDGKAIIFCQYMETVEALRQAFKIAGIGCVSLVGTDSTTKRMKAVDAFQQEAAVRVFITTIQAGGVGITLTAANYVFFASLPWTPALKRQCEDRAYRSGQKRDVFVIIPLMTGTIDVQINELLEAKREIEVSVVESKRQGVGPAGRPPSLVHCSGATP